MRNSSLVILVSVALAAGTMPLMAAGIAGTKHDLTLKGWGTAELCKYCHTPHLAQSGIVGAPLWNHKSTVQTYTLYSSATFQGGATVTQPGPQSKLCLSCHDGTVSIDAYYSGGVLYDGGHTMSSIGATTNMIGASGTLANDHPIAFTYNAALATADGHLVSPVSASYVDAAGQVPLYSGKLECASCHSSHDNTYGKFLRISNAGSALCVKCHTQ